MKSQNTKNILGRSRHALHAFFLLLMTVCMVFASSFVTLAVEQSGNETRINASDLTENQLLVLNGPTVLNMDQSITLTEIQGAACDLFIEGSGILTVDAIGCAINVYSLTAETGSNLTVMCDDREAFSIQCHETFEFKGDNLNVDAYYGIKSTCGDVIINASQSAVITARKGYAVLVEDNSKHYVVQRVEVSIHEKKDTLKASELKNGQAITLIGDTILEMDEEKTLDRISGAEYQLIINGPNPLTFETKESALYVRDLEVNTDLTVNSSCDNEYSIWVKNNFCFDATNLIVDAVYGIRSAEGTISIDADNELKVHTKKGANIVSEGGEVYIWSGKTWLKNASEAEDGKRRRHGVYAKEGVYITAEDMVIDIGTYGYGIESNYVKLDGSFFITAYDEAILSRGSISMNGYFKLQSRYVASENITLEEPTVIFSSEGNVNITGTYLELIGEIGIHAQRGGVQIDCKEIVMEPALSYAVMASEDIVLKGDRIQITSTYDRYKEDSDFVNWWKYGRAISGYTVTIDSKEAVIKGPTPVRAGREINLIGDVSIYGGDGSAVECTSGSVNLNGDITIETESKEDEYGIYAKQSISSAGARLYVKGPRGIYSDTGSIRLSSDAMYVKETVGHGIYAPKGTVHIGGGVLEVETSFGKDIVTGEDCTGIKSAGGVRLDCASANIIAPVGIQVSNGDVYLNGYTEIGGSKKGIHVEAGYIYINGYTKVGVLSGGDYAIRSDKNRIVVSASLPMVYPAGGSILLNPGRIVDSQGNTATEVEFGSEINEISFSMDVPVGLNLMSNKADAVYDLTPGCHVKSVDWYEGEDEDTMNKVVFSNASGVVRHFQAGKKYKATVLIETDDEYLLGYGFRKDDAIEKIASVNGSTDKVGMGYMSNGKEVYVSYDFGTCPTGFYTVDLSVDAPKDGKTPDISIDAAAYGYGVDSENVTWFVSDDGKQYKEMSSGTFFGGGKYYKVSMIVRVPGENFALGWTRDSVTGELEPRTRAFINEKPVDLVPVYKNDDPLHYLRHAEVSYEFGKCNKEVIDLIEVVGVTEPVAGEKPSYVAGVRGTGYHINAYKNNSTYGIRNGVRWFDVTDFDYVYENETFVSGHEYRIDVYLVTDDGYTFYHSNSNGYYEMLFTATVNGNTARGNTSGSSGLYEQTIMCNFICGEPQGSGNNSYSVSGDVTSSGSEIADVTIQLYEEKNPSEPAYETTAVGNDASYMIAGVAPGTYMMKVKKANHVEREYMVVVTDKNVEVDTKIHLLGDISGDGQVNIADNTRMIRHIKKTKLLTGYEFEVADISGDDQVNIADNTRMIRHIKKTKLLW